MAQITVSYENISFIHFFIRRLTENQMAEKSSLADLFSFYVRKKVLVVMLKPHLVISSLRAAGSGG